MFNTHLATPSLSTNLQSSILDLLPSLLPCDSPLAFDFLLKSRHLHEAIDSISVDIDGLPCNILDDAGRRLEPQEWIHRFQGLDAIIYVVSLPSYCQFIPGHSSKVDGPESSQMILIITNIQDLRTR